MPHVCACRVCRVSTLSTMFKRLNSMALALMVTWSTPVTSSCRRLRLCGRHGRMTRIQTSKGCLFRVYVIETDFQTINPIPRLTLTSKPTKSPNGKEKNQALHCNRASDEPGKECICYHFARISSKTLKVPKNGIKA